MRVLFLLLFRPCLCKIIVGEEQYLRCLFDYGISKIFAVLKNRIVYEQNFEKYATYINTYLKKFNYKICLLEYGTWKLEKLVRFDPAAFRLKLYP